LDPEGVRVVLEQTGAQARGLSRSLTGRGGVLADGGASIVDGVRSGGWVTAAVPAAVQAALEAQARQVAAILDRAAAGQVGVLNAALTYQEGNLEMAGVFQRAAADAAFSGDLSFFERYGVV